MKKQILVVDDDQLMQSGSANNNLMSVAGLGFVCAGHVSHHMRIIRERYLGEPNNNNGEVKVEKAPKAPKKKKKK